MRTGLTLAASFLAAALVTAILALCCQRWLAARSLFDWPGPRRLHLTPVPRGGGLAITTTISVALVILGDYWLESATIVLLCLIGLLPVTLVGWLDDQRGVGIVQRLLAHTASGGALAILVVSVQQAPVTNIMTFAGVLILFSIVFTTVASINLHNFMDGANGMLSTQSLFVFLILTMLAVPNEPLLAMISVISAGAVCGFLPFNFPRAKLFLGDSGSGALGFLIAGFCWWSIACGVLTLAEALLLNSLFLIDSGCTLSFRIAKRKYWWRGHREHLYQWLIRAGYSHAAVVGFYQLWNLLLVFPVFFWIRRNSSELQDPVAPWASGITQFATSSNLSVPFVLVIFLFGVIFWCFMKCTCLHRFRAQ